MFKNKILAAGVLIAAISVVLLVESDDAFARGEISRRTPSHQSQSHYRSAPALPRNSISIDLGGLRFYYSSGSFYRNGAKGYVAVRPPRGAVITRLPIGYSRVVIMGDTYYYYDGAYYKTCPAGYIVVPTPVTAVEPVVVQPALAPAARVKAADGTVVINVPNSNGSYTPVVLQKSGTGYTGPQGEYYPDNPTIEQLKALYGR